MRDLHEKKQRRGLSQEFNSLDAQREAGEAYIASQRHEGWVALADRYDDGGFTGGNMERPALRQLVADIEAGRIDCVVVYKVDRLSRSLLDFARLMALFEKHGASFISVTQTFNSATSMGRLTLNILLSFAEFERQIIGERTRDKISAARRKGKWTGGSPVLGYDVDPRGGRLVVNEDEAARVRAIFDLYLEHRSLIAVAREVNGRGWTTKRWTTKDGREHRGRPLGKGYIYKVLTNVIYTGQVNHKGTIYPGEHPAIIGTAVFQKVNERLSHNGITGGKEVRNKYGALLRGLLYCDACGTAMHHTYTAKGARRYRYYVCHTAQQQGWDACPSKSLQAQQIEDAVVEHVRALARNPEVVLATVRAAQEQSASGATELRAELQAGERELRRLNADLVKVAATTGNGIRLDRMADLQERIGALEHRMSEIRTELSALEAGSEPEEKVLRRANEIKRTWRAANGNVDRGDRDKQRGPEPTRSGSATSPAFPAEPSTLSVEAARAKLVELREKRIAKDHPKRDPKVPLLRDQINSLLLKERPKNEKEWAKKMPVWMAREAELWHVQDYFKEIFRIVASIESNI